MHNAWGVGFAGKVLFGVGGEGRLVVVDFFFVEEGHGVVFFYGERGVIRGHFIKFDFMKMKKLSRTNFKKTP